VLNNNISATGKEDRFRLSDDSWGWLIDILYMRKKTEDQVLKLGEGTPFFRTL
jgi:hypothetical protein